MKNRYLIGILLLSAGFMSCSGSGEKTVHDTIYVSAQQATELLTPEVAPGANPEGESHYTMLDGNAPAPTEPKKESGSNRSSGSESLSYTKPAESVPAPSWRSFTLNGHTEVNGKRFQIRVTGQKKASPSGTSYRNCKYTNVYYNVTFPVNVYENHGNLTIVNSKSDDDVRIEVYRDPDDTWEGTMYADGFAIPCYLY